MNRYRFTGIRWKLTLYSAVLAFVVWIVTLTVISSVYRLNTGTLWLVHTPQMLLIIAFILVLGLLPGFLFGSRLKRRAEQLRESIYFFERGDFTHRLPDGCVHERDELGLIGLHLNEMAERIESQVASLQKLSAQNTEMAEQLQKSAILEERQRIARDLHDAVSQQLFAISMMAAAIQESDDLNTEKVRKRIAAVQVSAGEAQKEMRSLLMQLRPATLEGRDLAEGIEELLRQLTEKHDIAVDRELGDVSGLPRGITEHLFRITQESVSNVIRHSQATVLIVKLRKTNNSIHLSIADNGIGFDKDEVKQSSYGMVTLQERAREIGGTADVRTSPGKGTQIYVKVPIWEREEEQES